MKEAVKVAVRLSEVRQRLNELGGNAELTVEERAEIDTLSSEFKDLETRGRALAIAQEEETLNPPAVDPEKRALIEAADLSDIYSAVVEHRATTGATKELQDELGLAANVVPLALLETRDVTPAPGNVGQNQGGIIPGVFPASAHAWLGIPTPRVGVGESVFPVLTTNATAHTPAENAAAADTTGSFSAEMLSPARIQGAFFYSREDRARFSGMAEGSEGEPQHGPDGQARFADTRGY